MAPIAGKAYTKIEGLGKNAIVCDTGGTTFDVALVRDGTLTYTRDSWLGRPKTGHVIALSSVDVRSIGAGGGSIAQVDDGGMLRVGPQSAGVNPGPACYGRGGTEATVTDASVVLGYINPAYFNGGRIALDSKAAHAAIAHLAKKIKKSTDETAEAIIALWSDHMVKAIREITINEGIDPKESVIVAGGGAAGINIAEIARELGCSRVLIPKTASTMSACGMHFSDIVFEETHSMVTASNAFNKKAVNAQLRTINGTLEIFRKGLKGAADAPYKKEFFVEARYRGQVWELDTPLRSIFFKNENDVRDLVEDFHNVHERVYAVRDTESDVECINWRGRISIRLANSAVPRSKRATNVRALPENRRKAVFSAKKHLIPIYRGHTLEAGAHITGPAIIEEITTTIVIPRGASVKTSASGNYILFL